MKNSTSDTSSEETRCPEQLEALKERPQWVIWRYEKRKPTDKKPTKVLYRPANPRSKARANDPKSWGAYDDAVKALEQNPRFNGIGYVFAEDDPYTGIDLDACLIKDSDTPDDWAQKIVHQFPETYWERSVSGTGLHAILEGRIPDKYRTGKGTGRKTSVPLKHGEKQCGIEVYDKGRFFTVSGDVFVPHPPGKYPVALPAFMAEHFPHRNARTAVATNIPEDAPPPMPEKVVEALAHHDVRFRCLWQHKGKKTGDRSRSGWELSMLIRAVSIRPEWTDRTCWSLIIAHRLKYPGGNPEHACSRSYAKDTIGKARAFAAETAPEQERTTLVTLDTLQPKCVDWLWENRIPSGMISLMVGDTGLGKSTITQDLAARVSTGAEWPDGTPGGEPGDVLLLSAEDPYEEVIVPRLLAAGGDVTRIHQIPALIGETTFSLIAHVEWLREQLDTLAAPRLLIIDPPAAFFGTVKVADAYRQSDVRNVLTPWAELAADTGVAVVLVMHWNKTDTQAAINRVAGSGAWVHLARLAHGFVRYEDGVAVVEFKRNVGLRASGLKYQLESADVDIGGDAKAPAARVQWDRDARVTVSLDALLAAQRKKKDIDPTAWKAIEELHQSQEPMTIKAVAEALDANKKTLEKVFKKMRAEGWIEVVDGNRKGGYQYRVNAAWYRTAVDTF